MNDSVKSAVRVLELFELFDRRQTALTLREIIAATGYPQSSTAALLGTLVRMGYIAHDRRNHLYAPTLQTSYLGAWIVPGNLSQESDLMRLLDRLHDATGETAVIGERAGNFVRYIHVKQARRPIMFHTQPGVLRPLCSSATGLALLSLMDDRELRKVVGQIKRDRTAGNRSITLREVRQKVADVKRYGFSVSRGAVYPTSGMIAVPLPLPVRGRYVAIGVGGPIERLDAQVTAIVRQLRAAVQEWQAMLAP